MLLFVEFLAILYRPSIWGLLKDYQQKRLTIFLDPYSDPLGAGYHIIQSLYAIGNGGFIGTGLRSGDLSQGSFVPEQHTDFIFSLVGEELGFIGTGCVIFLYALLCIQIIMRARNSDNKFHSLLAIGIFSMFIFHIFVNIGMNLSLMPITGVPLPFLSYGGTSLLVNTFLMSLVAKVYSENQKGV
jgi:rod shape determining protein RodA